MKCLVTKSKLDSLADVVAEKTSSDAPLTIDQMISLLNRIDAIPNRILTGTTIPDNSLGVENDVYFQITSDNDLITEYTLYNEGCIEQNGVFATSASQILNNSFYLLSKSKTDTTYYYYYTNQYIYNDNTNYILKTAGNDICRAALYHADQVGDTESFHIYFIDDNDTNNYIRLTASNNIYFTTDISEATIFVIESTTFEDQFLVKGTNIPNTTASYHLNSKAGDNGIGFQGSTFTDGFTSFLLANSISFDKTDPYELDGEKIVIFSNYNGNQQTLSSKSNNSSSLKPDAIEIYASDSGILSGNLTLWDVEATGNGTYILKDSANDKYLKLNRSSLTVVSDKSNASEIDFSFASNSSSLFKGKVRLTELINGFKFNTPIEVNNNYFSVRSNSNNNGASVTNYAKEWLKIAFRNSLTTPIHIKKIYAKQNNLWVEKTEVVQFLSFLKVIDMSV